MGREGASRRVFSCDAGDQSHALITLQGCEERPPLGFVQYNTEGGKNEAEVLMGTAEKPEWKTDDRRNGASG